jgi:signal transduction histidine kinase
MAIGDAEELPTRSGAADDQAALLQVAMLVLRDAPPETVFGAVAEQTARRLGTEAAVVLRFLGDERAVVVGVWREDGIRGLPVNAELDFDARNSATGRVRSTGRPARADRYDEFSGDLPLQMRAIGVRSSVAAPVMVSGEVWGTVAAVTTRSEPLPVGSEHRIDDLAALAAHAVAHAEARRDLVASRRRIVEDADQARRRLERDLHQGPEQHLLALTLTLRLARARATSRDLGADVVKLLDDAIAETDAANDAIRELARDLYPIVLSERGLAAAVQAVAARSPVPVYLQELPRRRFPAIVEATAYFVVSETIAAAAEHDRLSDVRVVAADRGELLVVEVRHESIGELPARLRSLGERVVAVGGRLHDDDRSVLRAEFPIEREPT